jgi:hypothetical protein
MFMFIFYLVGLYTPSTGTKTHSFFILLNLKTGRFLGGFFNSLYTFLVAYSIQPLDYGLDEGGIDVRVPAGTIDFLFSTSGSALCLTQPPVEYRGLFSSGKACRSMNLTTHHEIVSRLRTMELNLHSLIHLRGAVLIEGRNNFTCTRLSAIPFFVVYFTMLSVR